MPKKKYLETGQIVSTHGIRGEVRVNPWCDTPEFLAKLKVLYFDEGKTALKVHSRPHKNIVIMKIDGVDTAEAAAALRGRVLYLDRDDVKLPEGVHFIQDLTGLKVVDAETGEEYGILSDVSPTGANDVYHIKTPKGEVLIPAVPEVVKETDIDGGIMRILPIKGMFDDED